MLYTQFFFTESKAGRFKGRPCINKPWKLNEDLTRYSTSGMKLKTNEDLETLKEIAQDRKRWKELTDGIYRTTKALKNLVYKGLQCGIAFIYILNLSACHHLWELTICFWPFLIYNVLLTKS